MAYAVPPAISAPSPQQIPGRHGDLLLPLPPITFVPPPISVSPAPTPSDVSSSSGPASPASTPASSSTPTPAQPASSGTSSTDGASPTASNMTTQSSSSDAPLPISISPSPSPTLGVPTFVAASRSSNHAGAIAGGVIGGLAFIALVIGAVLFFLRRHNKRLQRNATPWSGGGIGRRHGDVRISSSSGLAGASDGINRMSGHSFAGYPLGNSAMGGGQFGRPMAAMPPRMAHQHNASTSSHTNHSRDSVEGSSEDEEKTLQHHGSTYSHGKKSIDLSDHYGMPEMPMEPPSAYQHGARHHRTPSAHQTAVPAFDPTILAQGANVSRSPSAATYASSKDPFASPTDQKAQHRLSGGGGVSRRPTRKAVPKYDAAEFNMTDLASPTSPTSPVPPVSPTPAEHYAVHPPSPPPANIVATRAVSPPYALSRSNSGSGSGHGSNSNLAVPLPALNHKSSFGDKPVHYIIPDLPPPRVD